MGKILRRTFLVGTTAIAGGLAFGYYKVKSPYPNPLEDTLEDGQTTLNPYLLIDQQGITIIAPRSEMGQGVCTTLAAMVAEELDVKLQDVSVINGPASKAYFNGAVMEEAAGKAATDESASAERMRAVTGVIGKLMGNQITGGSTSVPDAYDKMRKAGAAARIVLMQAAAREWKTNWASLKTDNGSIIHPDGRRYTYTELAVAARTIKPPKNPPLKPKSDWKLLGKSLDRIDMVGKCTGTAQYAIDVRLPNMVFATVKTNPNLGAGISAYDASRIENQPDIKKVIGLENGVAVIATNSWKAFQAIEEIDVTWEKAAYPQTTAKMIEGVAAAFNDKPDSRKRDDGDIETALTDGDLVEADYTAPYLAHSTMEPMNCVAHLQEDRLDIWVGTQSPTRCATIASDITGLPEKKIHVHTMMLGGGFGRRGETDFVHQAVTLAKEMKGTPVKMTWTREEDMRHDTYRPLSLARFKGAIKDGKISAFDMHVSASAAALDGLARQGTNVNIPDPTIIQNAWDAPYAIENYRVSGYKAPTMLPVGFWRSVGASQNAFFQESAIDELAHKAGIDPLEVRLQLINHDPSRKVLEAVGALSNWGAPLDEGHARGLAFYLSFGVPTAEVIEIADTPRGIKLVNAYAVVDVGTALDPHNIDAQVQSAMVYGLTAAIMGEISVDDGRVMQSNFHDYDAMRIYQAPQFKVQILENGHKIRGIGEPGTPPTAPALANAIFALTGKRIRELPLNKSIDFA